jgi:hypothetical protein
MWNAGEPWLRQDALLALCDLAAVADGRLRFWAVAERPAEVSLAEVLLDASELDLARHIAGVLHMSDRLPALQLVREFESFVNINNPVARLLRSFWEASSPGP